MDKEGRLRRHRLDLVDRFRQRCGRVGVGRQMKADMAVADLHKSQLAFGRLGRSGVADQPSVRGTPPLMLQTTPVPAQAMHFNRPRRFIFTAPNRSSSSRSAISYLLNGVVSDGESRPMSVPVYSRGARAPLRISAFRGARELPFSSEQTVGARFSAAVYFGLHTT
jgi:hypothetical protein